MWGFVLSVIFLLLVNWNVVKSHQLPSYITPCNRLETFLKCIENNLDVIKPKMKEGIPELFIPPMDPLVIPPTTLNDGDQVIVNFQDIEIFHGDNFKINQFDIDLANYTVNITVTFPKLRIKSNYNVNGRFLMATLNRTGPADGNYTNFRIQVCLKGTPYFENDLEYLKWENESMSISIEKTHVIFENIFGDHADIREKTNKMINDNIDTLISDLQPILQKVVSDLIFSVLNNLFSTYSVNELLGN